MTPMESQGWRKKSTVTVLYSYSYPVSSSSHDGAEVSMREGERLILLEKSNTDWWQVRRPGDKSQPFYAPANYLQEDGISKAKKAASSSSTVATAAAATSSPAGHKSSRRNATPASASSSNTHLIESRSDDCLQSPSQDKSSLSSSGKWSMRVANAELRKQRSTSMDAIMFLELLENEIKDMPGGSGTSSGDRLNRKGANNNNDVLNTSSSSGGGRQMKSESLVDRFKKPRISKDLWERRKSWAVEELSPAVPLLAQSSRHPALKEETANINSKRRSMQSLLLSSSSTSTAPPLPPRLSTSAQESQSSSNNKRDKTAKASRDDSVDSESDKTNCAADKAPALPPKKNPNQGVVVASSPRLTDNYSRVMPLRSVTPSGTSSGSPSVVKVKPAEASQLVNQNRLSESLEKLAQQIQTPLSYPHPIPPPRRSSSESMERSAASSSSSPPRLPPKISIAKLPPAAKPSTPKYFTFTFLLCAQLIVLFVCVYTGRATLTRKRRSRIMTSTY